MTNKIVTPKITDAFEFGHPNPSYDAVQDKLCELALRGWTSLKYEKGSKYTGGNDPYDTDYTINARIEGIRPATPVDAVKIIHRTEQEMGEKIRQIDAIQEDLKQDIKEHKKDVCDLENGIRQDKKTIAVLSKLIKGKKVTA
jgi:hypothetical protein